MNKENAFIIKCSKAENDDESNSKHRWFNLIKGNDEYDKYYDWGIYSDEYYLFGAKDLKYVLSNCSMEAELDLTQQVKIKIRILKNARVLGNCFLDSIDKPLSNNHDYEFKEKFEDVLLSDIYKKYIVFRYTYGKEFYYPIIAKNKDDEEGEYGEPYLCDNFQNITMLTFDEKGYVTGIYKGEN